jgi:hypothetical protein
LHGLLFCYWLYLSSQTPGKIAPYSSKSLSGQGL